jgi:acetyl esterase/lipase
MQLDATRYVYENIAKRLILAGSSAGGYLALATASSAHAPPILSLLSIYGMLDLTHSRYVRPGQILKVPVDNITKQLEDIYRASETSKAIGGYMFPENLLTDKRFH